MAMSAGVATKEHPGMAVLSTRAGTRSSAQAEQLAIALVVAKHLPGDQRLGASPVAEGHAGLTVR